MMWQPIETAPDKELVLIACEDGNGGFAWVQLAKRGREAMRKVWYLRYGQYAGCPTHWMPCPALAQKEQDDLK